MRRPWVGGCTQAGEPGPHRRPGRADSADQRGLGTVGIDTAASLPPLRADRPEGRRSAAGVRPVRSRNPNDRWTGDALHGPRIGGRKTYLFAFLDDHCRLVCGYRFGFAERRAVGSAALEPAWPAAASRAASMSTTARRSWIPGCCGRARNWASGWSIHPAPAPRTGQDRAVLPHGAGTVLVEITDTTAEELAAASLDARTALAELNALLTAWIETEYHQRIHTETGQTPTDRWQQGWSRLGRTRRCPPQRI